MKSIYSHTYETKKKKGGNLEVKFWPGTSKSKRSRAGGNFDISEKMYDVQQKCFYQSVD